MSQPPYKQLDESKRMLNQLMKQHKQAFNRVLEKKTLNLSATIDKLSLLNTLEVMKRGFAIPFTTNGELIKSKGKVYKNDLVPVELSDGHLDCQVLEIEEK